MRMSIPLTTLAAALLAAALSACGASHSPSAATTPKPAVTRPKATPSPSCKQLVVAWRYGIGGADYTKATNDARMVQQLVTMGATGEVQLAGRTWAKDSKTAYEHPMPQCADPAGAYPKFMVAWEKAAMLTGNGELTSAVPYLTKATRDSKLLNRELSKVS